MGGDAGRGSVTKFVALAMGIDLLLAECLTLGAKAGVSVHRLVEVEAHADWMARDLRGTRRESFTI